MEGGKKVRNNMAGWTNACMHVWKEGEVAEMNE